MDYSITTPDIGNTPNQPGINFPKRSFGQKKPELRAFQPSWFNQFAWLHYDESHDMAFCYTCIKAYKAKKLNSPNMDSAFIAKNKGFKNWKEATRRFKAHEGSVCHKDAVLMVVTLPKITKDIGESLSQQIVREREERRQIFMKIISNVRFLARQGLAFRGDGDESDSNLITLFKLRGEDDSRIQNWLSRKSDKYLSAEIQNEILQTMALTALREVVSNIQTAPFYTIMVDETPDVSNKEQVVICIRWVDDLFEVHEDFIGLYEVSSTTADALVAVIKDVLLRMQLSLQKARGQCYDGAAAMSGVHGGVAKKITDEQPKALYTHCYGHALNLACGDTIKRNRLMCDALENTREITKLIRNSPRRGTKFIEMKERIGKECSTGIRVMCPTRWTVRADALRSILENYEVLQNVWEECLLEEKDPSTKGRLRGVASYMKKFDFLFGIKLAHLILSHSDNLSRTLQHAYISAAEGQSVAEITVSTIEGIRSQFDTFWEAVGLLASTLNVNQPETPRRRKVPIRLDGPSINDQPASGKEYFKRIYTEAIDNIVNCIRDRFKQTGYQTYVKLQNLLLDACNGKGIGEDFHFVSDFYKDDIDSSQLRVQLETLGHTCKPPECTSVSVYSLPDIVKYMKSLDFGTKLLLSEVCILLKLVLVMPATNAVSERSFSALKRIKTYMRATMKQKRLNHLLVLHVHKDTTDSLDLTKIASEFAVVQFLDHFFKLANSRIQE